MNKEETSRAIFGVGRSDGYGELTALTPAQYAAIVNTLAATDELDAVYDQEGGGRSYAAAFRVARESHEEAKKILPQGDLRTNLLEASIKIYQDVGTLIVGSELNRWQGSTKESMLAARMRKGFLRKILNNTLDPEGQDFLNYLLRR